MLCAMLAAGAAHASPKRRDTTAAMVGIMGALVAITGIVLLVVPSRPTRQSAPDGNTRAIFGAVFVSSGLVAAVTGLALARIRPAERHYRAREPSVYQPPVAHIESEPPPMPPRSEPRPLAMRAPPALAPIPSGRDQR